MYNRPFRRNSYHSSSRVNRFSGSRNRAPNPASIYAYISKASVQGPIIDQVQTTMQFNDLPINDKLKNNIAHRGYAQLMPIQEKGIQAILDGKDVIGIANTGTGKTAAFLIPLIEKIIKNPKTIFGDAE